MNQPIKLKRKIHVHIDGYGACWKPTVYEPYRPAGRNGIRWNMDAVEASAHERQVMCR